MWHNSPMQPNMNHSLLKREHFSLVTPIPLQKLEGLAEKTTGVDILGVARFGYAQTGDLCFCDRGPSQEYINCLSDGALILCTEALVQPLCQRYPGSILLPTHDPRATFIDFCQMLMEDDAVNITNEIPSPLGTHPSAQIGSQTVIHPESRIDENVFIGSNCVIHRGTWIKARAVIRDHVTIGVEGINAYRGEDGRQRRFPHLAGTIIGSDVEIGASTVVVRGILNSTRIGDGTVIGNLCNIGHVVEIGEKVWMSVGCLIGGHTQIATGATLGMGVAVKDNIEIGENAQVGMGSIVAKSIKAGASVFGNPARSVGAIQAGPAR